MLRDLVLRPPPNLTSGINLRSFGELLKAGAFGNRLRRLSTEKLRTVYDLFTKSAGDYLDGWFEGDLLKALFGFDAVVGNYASPYTPGTAYVLLHHAFGEVNGKKRIWGHAIGGMGAITQAMAKAASSHGVEIETNAAVREVIVEGDRVAGVTLADGRSIKSHMVASNVNPKLLYMLMIPAGALDEDFLRRIHNWRCGSGTFRMNVALSELPSFTALPGSEAADHHTAGIIMAPSLAYMDRAHGDARAHGWSREPIIEMLIPSTLDDTLAPRGAHVASLFCQHVAPRTARRPLLGRPSRGGRRPDDRHRRAIRAGLQGERPRPPVADAARPRDGRSGSSAATSSTARSRSTSCSGRGRCWAMPTIAARSRGSTTAARARILAAASPGRPGITPRRRFWRTGGGGSAARRASMQPA